MSDAEETAEKRRLRVAGLIDKSIIENQLTVIVHNILLNHEDREGK